MAPERAFGAYSQYNEKGNYIKNSKTAVMTIPARRASLAFGPTGDASMGMTIVEKIMVRASGAERIKPGDLVVVWAAGRVSYHRSGIHQRLDQARLGRR